MPSNSTHTLEIKHNGQHLMAGDDSCRIVFQNLTGENFEALGPWALHTHQQYMEDIQCLLDVTFKAGDVVTIHAIGQAEATRTHTIPANVLS
jgi:hypothetical protein